MALTTIEPLVARKGSRKKDKEALSAPLDVVTTPCDPWPRPYYLEDDLRKVHPYHFTYNTYCKERWRGRELLDIFATEFRDRPQAYYVKTTFFR
jgi:tRNA pseudouridine synthase 9